MSSLGKPCWLPKPLPLGHTLSTSRTLAEPHTTGGIAQHIFVWHNGKPHGLMTQKIWRSFFTQEREVIVAFAVSLRTKTKAWSCSDVIFIYIWVGKYLNQKDVSDRFMIFQLLFHSWDIWNESVIMFNAGGSVTKTTLLRAPLLVSISFLIPQQEHEVCVYQGWDLPSMCTAPSCSPGKARVFPPLLVCCNPAIYPRAMEMSWHWASSQNTLRLAGSTLSSLTLLHMLLNQNLKDRSVCRSKQN